MALKWGIAGAGKISHDFVNAVQTCPNEHQVVAVASGSLENAQKFAKENNIETAYQGYESIATDKNVDVVYVANLNTQHFATVKLMLNNGKPVLCEKPFTINEKQTRELLDLAKAKNLFIMEAVWSRCFPVYRELKQIIDRGDIGEVLFASTTFGVPIQSVARVAQKDLGGGAILDLGVYILQFQQYVFRGLKPLNVTATGHLNQSGVDESVGAVITYPNGKMAVVSASARVQLPNEATVVGTKGTIRIPMFWCPTKLIIGDEVKEFPLPETKATFVYGNSVGLYYEAAEVKKCLAEGKLESGQITRDETLQLSQLMDSLRRQVGVIFPEDI